MNFFFLNIEETSDVLDYLLVGKSQLVTGRTIRRRGGDDIRGVASTLDRGQRTGGDKNGGG